MIALAKKIWAYPQTAFVPAEKEFDSCTLDDENAELAVQRAYKDKHVYGCSAEGHVSHIYADRMSSRPMGWSETGSDRMCRSRN